MGNNDEIKISDKRASHLEEQAPSSSSYSDGKNADVNSSGTTSNRAKDASAQSDQAGSDRNSSKGSTIGGKSGSSSHQFGDGQPISLLDLNFTEITEFWLGILIQKAWMSLGVIANPSNGRIERDLAEARRFIDLIGHITTYMQGKWGQPGLEQELQAQLTNLRLNFAKFASS